MTRYEVATLLNKVLLAIHDEHRVSPATDEGPARADTFVWNRAIEAAEDAAAKAIEAAGIPTTAALAGVSDN